MDWLFSGWRYDEMLCLKFGLTKAIPPLPNMRVRMGEMMNGNVVWSLRNADGWPVRRCGDKMIGGRADTCRHF